MTQVVKLNEESLSLALETLPMWKREEQWIVRRFRFPSFMDAIAFVNHIATQAEAFVHHPLISIDYKHVTLRLTTWHASGLTELDIQSARAADAHYEAFAERA